MDEIVVHADTDLGSLDGLVGGFADGVERGPLAAFLAKPSGPETASMPDDADVVVDVANFDVFFQLPVWRAAKHDSADSTPTWGPGTI